VRRGPIIVADTAEEASKRAEVLVSGDADYVSTGAAIFMHDGNHRKAMLAYVAAISMQRLNSE